MPDHIPYFDPPLTSKEILMLIHALNEARETGMLYEIAKPHEIERLRTKLSNVK